MNYENEILAELKRSPGTAADIADAIGLTVNDIRTTLRALRDAGSVVMGSRGVYQLAKPAAEEKAEPVKAEKQAGPQKAPAAPVKKKPANKSTADKALIDQPTLSDVLDAMEQRLSKPGISNKAEKEKALARLAEMSDEPLRTLLVEIADDLSVIEAA